MNSELYYEPANNTWRLQSLRRPEKYVLLSPPSHILPIGSWNWAMGSDAALCGKDKGEILELTFSLCYPEKYTCNDGSCIPLA